MWKRFLGIHFPEALKLLARHKQIHIVIPGNEPMVPHRPQESAVYRHVPEAVFGAYSIQLLQQLHLDRMNGRQENGIIHSHPPAAYSGAVRAGVLIYLLQRVIPAVF